MNASNEHEHLFIGDLRNHPDGEVRLYSRDGRLISGTRPYQVVASIDAMIQSSTEASK